MAKKKVELPKCYIDSCVFLSYIEQTKDRIGMIDDLFAECESRWTAYTSHLTIAEVAFAQWEKTNVALEPEVEAKIDALWLPGSPFELAEVSEFVTKDAKALIRRCFDYQWTGLKASDAIHLATAKRLKATQFFTYDTKLERYEAIMGFKIGPPCVIQSSMFSRPAEPTTEGEVQ